MKVNDKLLNKYFVKTSDVPTRPGCWNYLKVEVFMNEEQPVYENGQMVTKVVPVKIGEYERNYSSLMNTFHPFEQNGKHYALYSPKYTATRIMSLPDCKDIGREEPSSFGFCPVEYAVWHDEEEYMGHIECLESDSPTLKKYYAEHPVDLKKLAGIVNGHFGFVAGCVWGDDTSWKIQALDLSQASNGIVKRSDWFGYMELPEDCSLKDAIAVKLWEPDNWRIGIPTVEYFDFDTKTKVSAPTEPLTPEQAVRYWGIGTLLKVKIKSLFGKKR
jgi:hypothetical protein